jgi:hypothetical protein
MIGGMENADFCEEVWRLFAHSHFDRHPFGTSSLRSNYHLTSSMAKAIMPYATVSAFQAAGLARCRQCEKCYLWLDRNQARRIRHWHKNHSVEKSFGQEEKCEIRLKSEENQIKILFPSQSYLPLHGNIKGKIVKMSMAERETEMWVSPCILFCRDEK